MGPDQVMDAACRFVGGFPPSGMSGRALLQRLLERVDQVPVGALTTAADLSDAAEVTPRRRARTIPPLPESIVDAVAFIDVMLARLGPHDLRIVAGELAIDRATALRAALLRWSRRQSGDQTHEHRLDVLESCVWTEWGPDDVAVLRFAMRLHLAGIGDAVLRASEWQPTSLQWLAWGNDGLTAEVPVSGAPRPLEAHINVLDNHLDTEHARAMFAAKARSRHLYRWRVGWKDGDETFRCHSSDTEASLDAARFGAETTIQMLAEDSTRARMRFTGTLLIPRTEAVRNSDGRVVDLRRILVATMNQRRCERWSPVPVGVGWSMRPHRTADADLGSVVAALFQHIGVPWPNRSDAACAADVGSREFAAFLGAHAIALTPLARCYLAGMGDAGPALRSLAERHAAGIRAVINNARTAGHLGLELPAWTDNGHYGLVDIDQLESYLTTPHPPAS
ncbi:hypothetical protein ACN27G_28815 [Plantactinospora sp. WMMB334]|uniref:hypothetical protein n=1 Tax=Plantactinospora sp. WMMB334 TaxID=3404119 RepID=UPI003B9322E1